MGNNRFIILCISYGVSVAFNIMNIYGSFNTGRKNSPDLLVRYLPTNQNLDYASWICGFTDGEGCFSVSFNKREELKTKIEVRPSFSISQKSNSLSSLEQIKNYFQCGGIRYSKSDGCYKYEVRSLSDLNEKIIPFFKKYDLFTAKKNDFEKFGEICSEMKRSNHLNISGLKKIIGLAYQMNVAGKRKYSYDQLIQIILKEEKQIDIKREKQKTDEFKINHDS